MLCCHPHTMVCHSKYRYCMMTYHPPVDVAFTAIKSIEVQITTGSNAFGWFDKAGEFLGANDSQATHVAQELIEPFPSSSVQSTKQDTRLLYHLRALRRLSSWRTFSLTLSLIQTSPPAPYPCSPLKMTRQTLLILTKHISLTCVTSMASSFA